MATTLRNIGMALSLVVVSGCGTTRQFVDEPQLTVDEPQKNVREAIGELFGSMTPPYSVRLCEADLASKECKTESEGVAAKGVGGLLLPIIPLTLHVRGMDIQSQRLSDDGLSFDAFLDAKVDAISPACGKVGGKVVVHENNTASVQFKNFYCNWVVVGNVLVNADFSIDSISLKDKVITGFYKLTFHGTGNALGSGYYKAVIAPKST
jgi:hypothetical protein